MKVLPSLSILNNSACFANQLLGGEVITQSGIAALTAYLIDPRKLSSSHGLTGTRASSPHADRMSALPVSILELAQKVNRINSDKVNHHAGFN